MSKRLTEPLTMESSLRDVAAVLGACRGVPAFCRTPDTTRYPELKRATMRSTAGYFCILRATVPDSAILCVGRGLSQVGALIDCLNKRTRHHGDLRECKHETHHPDCDPEVVEGHCRLCGRMGQSDLVWSMPGARDAPTLEEDLRA